MAEHLANLLVLPRRHLLEHVELPGDEAHAHARPPQQAQRAAEIVLVDERRCRRGVAAGELEPELGGLVHDLEQQLVAVDPLVRALLEGQQLLGVEIALVVAARLARQHGAIQRWLEGFL